MKCKICNEEVCDLHWHVRSEHNMNPKTYYNEFIKGSLKCLNCGFDLWYEHDLNRSVKRQFCSKSCQMTVRNLNNSREGKNPFQSINLKRDANGGSIVHKVGHQHALESGKFNWMNNGTEECLLRLSEMHKITALHQIENGNSIYSAKFHSSTEELMIGGYLKELNINHIPQYHDERWSRKFKADYYLPDYNLIIEIDGDFKYCNGILGDSYIERELQIYNESRIPMIHIKASEVWKLDKDSLMRLIIQEVQRLSNDGKNVNLVEYTQASGNANP